MDEKLDGNPHNLVLRGKDVCEFWKGEFEYWSRQYIATSDFEDLITYLYPTIGLDWGQGMYDWTRFKLKDNYYKNPPKITQIITMKGDDAHIISEEKSKSHSE